MKSKAQWMIEYPMLLLMSQFFKYLNYQMTSVFSKAYPFLLRLPLSYLLQ